MLMQLAARRAGLARAHDGANALGQHQRPDDAEKHHIGQLDDKVDLPDIAQEGEQRDTKGRADHAACHQDRPHLEVDIAAAHMRQHA